MNKVLKSTAVNGWSLFWIISGPISLAMIIGMLRSDLSSGPAVSAMIQASVRCAVPWLFLAFAASSVQILWPGPLGLWLSRNRKFLGLCFAAAMAWQGFFILWMVLIYSDYYIDEVYVMRDAIEGVVGYLFLTAMTLTSFMPVRKHMTPKSWKLLHKSGIYFLWATGGTCSTTTALAGWTTPITGPLLRPGVCVLPPGRRSDGSSAPRVE
jgi:DMSO/TMAO reductase YedYZ heme-binding membrane subunit